MKVIAAILLCCLLTGCLPDGGKKTKVDPKTLDFLVLSLWADQVNQSQSNFTITVTLRTNTP